MLLKIHDLLGLQLPSGARAIQGPGLRNEPNHPVIFAATFQLLAGAGEGASREGAAGQSHHWVPNLGECPKFGRFDEMAQEWHRNSSSCQLALFKKTPPPYYFSEM